MMPAAKSEFTRAGSKQEKIVSIAERRHESRTECDPALVHAHLEGSQEDMPARIRELSPSGLLLQMDVPVAVGIHVTVDVGGKLFDGETRHCSLQADWSWNVGVQLRNSQ